MCSPHEPLLNSLYCHRFSVKFEPGTMPGRLGETLVEVAMPLEREAWQRAD